MKSDSRRSTLPPETTLKIQTPQEKISYKSYMPDTITMKQKRRISRDYQFFFLRNQSLQYFTGKEVARGAPG